MLRGSLASMKPLAGLTQRQVSKLATACRRSEPIQLQRAHVASRCVFQPFLMHRRFMQTRSATGPGVRVREKEHVQQGPVVTGSTPVVMPPHGSPSVSSSQSIATSEDDTAAARVIGNVGMSNFLGRTYKTTGLSVVATLLGGYGLAFLLPPAAFMPALVGGFVVSIGSIFALAATRPQTTRVVNQRGETELITVNPQKRQLAYGTFIAGNALTLTPLIVAMNVIHPLIIPISAVSAGVVMAGTSLVAYRKKAGSLLALQGPLFGGLLGLIVLNVGALASTAIWGPTLFSGVVFSAVPYATVGLFSVMNAFDTHAAIAEYERGEADHLGHAVGFYLNFLNLLTAIAQIIGNATKD